MMFLLNWVKNDPSKRSSRHHGGTQTLNFPKLTVSQKLWAFHTIFFNCFPRLFDSPSCQKNDEINVFLRQALEEAYRIFYDEAAQQGLSDLNELPEPPTSEVGMIGMMVGLVGSTWDDGWGGWVVTF